MGPSVILELYFQALIFAMLTVVKCGVVHKSYFNLSVIVLESRKLIILMKALPIRKINKLIKASDLLFGVARSIIMNKFSSKKYN